MGGYASLYRKLSRDLVSDTMVQHWDECLMPSCWNKMCRPISSIHCSPCGMLWRRKAESVGKRLDGSGDIGEPARATLRLGPSCHPASDVIAASGR